MATEASITVEPLPQSKVDAGPAAGPRASMVATACRHHWFPLLLVTVLALVLRVAGINTHSLWYDEAVTEHVTHATLGDIATGRARDNGSAPLYYIVMRIWTGAFGQSEAALRSFSVLCGTLAVAVLAILGRRLIGESCGLVAALLLAISPQALELSDEARCYPLLQLLAVASTLLLLRWLERRRASDLLAYLVTLLLCCWTHYYALAMPLVHVFAIAVVPRDRRRDLAFAGGLLAVAAIWSLWLPVFLDQLRTPNNLSRMEARWPLQFLATPLCFAFGRTLAWRDASRWLLLAGSLVAVGTFWIPAVLGVVRNCRSRFAQALLVAWAAMPIVAPLALALAGTPLYAVRYGTLGLPAFLLLAAQGILCMPRRVAGAIVGAILLFTAISLGNYFSHPLRDDWRSAATAMLSSSTAEAPVIFDTDIEVLPFQYYAARLNTVPQEMIGLVSGIEANLSLPGAIYENGRRQGNVLPDCTDTILRWPAFRLALCVSREPASRYVDLFSKYGFSTTDELDFHRIHLVTFVRASEGNRH